MPDRSVVGWWVFGRGNRGHVAFGSARAVSVYCALGAVGLTALAASATAGAHGAYWWAVAVPGVLFGLGTAAAFTPITPAATAGVPPARGGVAAGCVAGASVVALVTMPRTARPPADRAPTSGT
ncbi:hypothetical protein [Embleya sp. MST-111070]|uniref:hypothetical protein n=1 Tax=Embleya sp. MST-111070 TaxID=3398231 RepID=UPI003F73403C